MTTGLSIVLVFLILMGLSVPVFVAMALAGFIGFILSNGMPSAFYGFTEMVWQSTHVYELIAIPLFILTGTVMQQSGAGRDLYLVVNAFAGKVRNASGIASVSHRSRIAIPPPGNPRCTCRPPLGRAPGSVLRCWRA